MLYEVKDNAAKKVDLDMQGSHKRIAKGKMKIGLENADACMAMGLATIRTPRRGADPVSVVVIAWLNPRASAIPNGCLLFAGQRRPGDWLLPMAAMRHEHANQSRVLPRAQSVIGSQVVPY